jgi:phosphoadenosine phosphosulfate reductase
MKYDELLTETKNLSWKKKLKLVGKLENVIFSTSFSLEDQIITNFIAENKLNIEIFTIDTGRLFNETYDIWQGVLDKYDVVIDAYYPDGNKLQEFVKNKGINSFYESKDLRLSCCNIRKVEPLKRALKNKNIWISGVRKDHSEGRLGKNFFERDGNLNITKFYPLLDMKKDELWDVIKRDNIPYNCLYDKNFDSIGCSPCSREGKGREGRWWWEDGHKECGLHLENGKLIRSKNDK